MCLVYYTSDILVIHWIKKWTIMVGKRISIRESLWSILSNIASCFHLAYHQSSNEWSGKTYFSMEAEVWLSKHRLSLYCEKALKSPNMILKVHIFLYYVDEKKKVVRKSLKLACSLTVELQLCIKKERKK
jgi:hypothetical protein